MSNFESKIKTSERVKNKDRKFGSTLEYFPAYIIDDTGQEIPALFTKNQLKVASDRAAKNMEDMEGESKSFWDWLFVDIF